MKQNAKKVMLGIAFLLIGLLVLTGCGLASEEKTEDLSNLPVVNAEENEGFTTYNDKSGVSFAYPSDWISMSDDMPMFYNPDGTGTSVNMTSEKVMTSISFSGYMEAAKTQVKKQMSVQGDIAQTELNLNGRRAYKLEYTATSEGITLKVNQVVIRDGETIYILTAGAPTDAYEAQKATLDKIMATFKK